MNVVLLLAKLNGENPTKCYVVALLTTYGDRAIKFSWKSHHAQLRVGYSRIFYCIRSIRGVKYGLILIAAVISVRVTRLSDLKN